MTLLINGIILVFGGIIFGLDAKRDFRKEQTRWAALEVTASVLSLLLGLSFIVFNLVT